jgi:hypothetical protein
MDQLTRRGARYAVGLACVELIDYTGPGSVDLSVFL